MNTNKTQILHRNRLRKFTTDTPSEESYTIENFRPDDYIVICQDDLYSIAWEAESDPSLLDHPKLNRDPATIERTDCGDTVTQLIVNRNCPRKDNNAPDPNAEAPTSSQD